MKKGRMNIYGQIIRPFSFRFNPFPPCVCGLIFDIYTPICKMSAVPYGQQTPY